MAIYKNIVTGATHDLIVKGSNQGGNISKITIANVDGHTADNVCVMLEDTTASTSTDGGNVKHYFIKDIDIPPSTTLVLHDNLGFNKDVYNLRIITQNASDGGTPFLTVIIK